MGPVNRPINSLDALINNTGSAKESQSQSQVKKKLLKIPKIIKFNPNPKTFEIQSQSKSFQNSIPILTQIWTKSHTMPRSSWDPNPKNILMKNVWNFEKIPIPKFLKIDPNLMGFGSQCRPLEATISRFSLL